MCVEQAGPVGLTYLKCDLLGRFGRLRPYSLLRELHVLLRLMYIYCDSCVLHPYVMTHWMS